MQDYWAIDESCVIVLNHPGRRLVMVGIAMATRLTNNRGAYSSLNLPHRDVTHLAPGDWNTLSSPSITHTTPFMHTYRRTSHHDQKNGSFHLNLPSKTERAHRNMAVIHRAGFVSPLSESWV